MPKDDDLYLDLDEDIVWNVVTVHLPPLVRARDRLLKERQ